MRTEPQSALTWRVMPLLTRNSPLRSTEACGGAFAPSKLSGRNSRENTRRNRPRQTQSLASCAEENAGLLEKPRITKDTRQRTWKTLLFVPRVYLAQGRSTPQTDVAAWITALKILKRANNAPERLVSGKLTGSRRGHMADLDHGRRRGRLRDRENLNGLVIERTHQQVHSLDTDTRVGVVFERIEQSLADIAVRG